MKRKLLLLCLLVQVMCLTGYAQGWQKKYLSDTTMLTNAFFQRADGTYIVTGSSWVHLTPSFVFSLSADGNILWKTDHDSIPNNTNACITPDGGMVIVSYGTFDINGNLTKTVSRVDSNGKQIWLRTLHRFYWPTHIGSAAANIDVDTTDDGGFICVFNYYDTLLSRPRLMVKRLDGNGNIQWQQTYFDNDSIDYGYRILNSKDGGFLIQRSVPNGSMTRLFKIDGNGGFLWEFNGASGHPLIAHDGNILLTSYSPSTGISTVGKVNQAGVELWSYPVVTPDATGFSQLIEIAPDTLAAFCLKYDTASTNSVRAGLAKFDTLGNVLTYKRIPTGNMGLNLNLTFWGIKHFIRTIDGGFALCGWIQNNSHPNLAGIAPQSVFVIKMDGDGKIYPNTISGQVFSDADSNCQRSANELYLKNNLLSFTSSTDTFYTLTTNSGYYSLGLNNDLYNITSIPHSIYWQAQSCNTSQLQISNSTDTVVHLGMKPLINSPYVIIDGQTRHRLCAASTYHLEYCNTGTETFYGVIHVTFDSLMTIDSSSVPWASQNNNNVYFTEGAGLLPGECRNLKIYYTLPCDINLMGRTTCVNAHAYNDTVLNASPLWDQSDLVMQVTYNALKDSVEFTLKNQGTGPMSTPEDLIVIEDNVILLRQSVQLPAGGVLIHKQKPNGATYRATILQTDYNPFSQFTTAAIEGAGATTPGTFSTGFITQYAINGAYAFDNNFCAPILNSFDPNRKTVMPEGAGPNHLVDSNTVLEYLLEFQNTGTDTAYVVRLVDTLPPYVDASTLHPGVSSHRYRFSFLSHNVIEFLFEGIYLPDSGTNQQTSNGFVKFKIKQTTGNAGGTTINNTAGIYFDYNSPVITNTATVRIGKLEFTGIKTTPAYNNLKIDAYPNPFTQQATIKVTGENFGNLQLTVYNLQGKMIQQQYVSNTNQFTVQQQCLIAGTYFFEIKTNNETIGRGKIIAQ